MAGFSLHGLASSTVGAAVLYLLYCVYWELTIGTSRRRLIQQHGCLPVKKYPHWDPILGLDFFRQTMKAFKARTFLADNRERFSQMGNTFEVKLIGQSLILTAEPENLKTMLALNFKHFGLGKRRKDALLPFLGPGIFATDGAQWQHSREMLRPNFVRSQVGDVKQTFGPHVDHLINAIPRDGSTIDLKPLFFSLTMDSATDFLFGESTNSLAPGTSTESSTRFGEAFTDTQEIVGRKIRFGMMAALLPSSKVARDIQFIHGNHPISNERKGY